MHRDCQLLRHRHCQKKLFLVREGGKNDFKIVFFRRSNDDDNEVDQVINDKHI
jgi:hypothetical protein